MFGYNPPIAKDEFESQKIFESALGRYGGGPLMRLVSSILLLNCNSRINKLDFRTAVLSRILLPQSIDALLRRIEGEEEKFLAAHDTQRTKIWGRYLAKQVTEKIIPSNRRIGYYPYRY